MKNKSKELDVDFIGGQERPLSKEEQAAISAFLQERKEQRRNKNLKGKKQTQKKNTSTHA